MVCMNRLSKFSITVLCLFSIENSGGLCQRVLAQSWSIPAAPISSLQTDILVPDLTVLEPEDARTTTLSESIRLRVLVRSRVPLVSVAVVQNGKPLPKVKFDGSEKERNRYILDTMVQLRPGENSISVTAVNEKKASNAATVAIVYNQAPATKPNLSVLAIGVSKSGGLSKFAAGDAEAFAKLMDTQKESSLWASAKTVSLLNKDASREAIIENLKWLRSRRTSPNDVTILFLSGTLATDYVDNSLYFLTAQHEPKTDLAVADVKYSLFWEVLNEGGGNTIIFTNTDWADSGGRYLLQRLTGTSKGRDWNTYFSSDDGFLTSIDPRLNHSAFTQALLEGLEGKADLEMPGAGKDRIIDTHELQTWIRWRVEDLTGGKQLPAIQVGSKRIPIFKITSNP
jgi:hypothetical protein